jgi:two-component system response regulator DevR
MKVFLVDEHEMVRRGVAAIITAEDDLQVVGQADTVRGALLRIPTVHPDVAVVGMIFDVSDGIELCREIADRSPGTACLVLTADTSDAHMLAALLAGAAGMIDKRVAAADLVAAIRMVGNGNQLLDRSAARVMLSRLRAPTPKASRFDVLTSAEHDVLDAITDGLTNKQIAARLMYAERTVKNYVSRIMSKIGVTSRTQAAMAVAEERSQNAATYG